jgi:hypothetical protein
MAFTTADNAGDFHKPVFDEINAVAWIAFAENFLIGGQPPFPGDEPKCLQFLAVKAAEKGDGFKSDHDVNLLENAPT